MLNINGQLGNWEKNWLNAKPIEIKAKMACLELFKQGVGHTKAAKELGLKRYTVRGWERRFRAGDESWATRDGRKLNSSFGTKNLVKYSYEIETFCSSRETDIARYGSCVGSEQPVRGRKDQMVGSAKHASPLPLYRADGLCRRVLDGRLLKKKEITAVRALVAKGRTIKEACRVAGIPRCAYYRALEPSAKAESDTELVKLMCAIENDSRISSTYGIERLTGEVNNRLSKAEPELMSKILRGGARVNHKRVHRLMKACGIHSRIRRKKYPDRYYKTIRNMVLKNKAPNILNRDFTSERPLTKLTTDVTYIPCSNQKFVYLSPLIDLFNHEIISYSISTVNSEEFVKRMLTALPPEALRNALVHNDQGAVYWSNGWVKLCERLQIVRSMSRRGNCWDNALSEHFFSAMKADLGLTKRGYKTLLTAQEIKDLINDYIPWYNNCRIQKKLGYMSPVQYKESFFKKPVFATGLNP